MKTALGQDSHRFEPAPGKPLVLGGVAFEGCPGLLANSDGDVVLHALTNAVSGITCQNVLGAPADALCRAGVTDSRRYLQAALADLRETPVHVSFSIECSRPVLAPRIGEMRRSIGALLGLPAGCVGITATSGEGLTACGRGEGVSVLCVLTVE